MAVIVTASYISIPDPLFTLSSWPDAWATSWTNAVVATCVSSVVAGVTVGADTVPVKVGLAIFASVSYTHLTLPTTHYV